MSFKREGDDKSQLNILKVTLYFLAFLEDTLADITHCYG